MDIRERRAYEVSDAAQDNLAEINRRYQIKLLILHGTIFLTSMGATYLVLRWLLWM